MFICKPWEGERHEFAIGSFNSKLLLARANSTTAKINCCQEKHFFHSAVSAWVLKFWLSWGFGNKASWSISIHFNLNESCWFIHWKAFTSWLEDYLFNKVMTRSSRILLVLSARSNRGKNYFKIRVGTLKFFQGFFFKFFYLWAERLFYFIWQRMTLWIY